MAKSGIIRARIEPELKEEAEIIFSALGLSITEAIRDYSIFAGFYYGLRGACIV